MHTVYHDPDEILNELVTRYPSLTGAKMDISSAFEMLSNAFQNGNKLLVCGNGGSAADALHIAGELMKSFIVKRPHTAAFRNALEEGAGDDAAFMLEHLEPALPVIPLVESAAVSTAIQNDTASVLVFAQQVYGLGKAGDILLCISTSGNSGNCIYAAKTAAALGMKVISLTGGNRNRLERVSNLTIKVPETETFKIQELHLPVYHTLCLMLENRFFV